MADCSAEVKVCRATAFATTFAIRVEHALDSGFSIEDMNLDSYAEEAQEVSNEAAKRYARVLNPETSKAAEDKL